MDRGRDMKEKTAKVTFNRSGGTASKNGMTNRITIPTSWIREMGITQEERDVSMEFDGEKIIIKKSPRSF